MYQYGCRNGKLSVRQSDEHLFFIQHAHIELFRQHVPRSLPFDGLVAMTMDAYVPSGRSDLSNYVKVAEDVLSDWLCFDDKLIYHITLRKFIDAKEPRVEVTIAPLERAWPVKKRSTRSKPSP